MAPRNQSDGLRRPASDGAVDRFFVGPELRESFAAGRVAFKPLSYFSIYAHLRDEAPIDVALLHLSPPDANGLCSLGVANDFTPAILDKVRLKIAHLNPRMPRTRGAAVPIDAIDRVIEEERPLLGADDEPDPLFESIGRCIAALLQDGDTLEVGVGRVQGVLAAFGDRRRLRLHTGAITTPVLRLAEAGAIADYDDAITTGVAYGGDDLYAFVADNPRVRFRPVGFTHDVATLRAIPRFIAVNSVIKVDLLGQANAEMVGGRQISSAGGIVDFMRGARLSTEGVAVVALPSTAKGGAVSRIVPHLEPGSAVSVARGDMDVVATEHGVADLRTASVDERAEALIAIAAPRFREELRSAWRQRRRRM